MSKAARIEALRSRLAAEAESKDWEWIFVSEILWVAKEMGRESDEVLEWSIMKFNIVRPFLKEYYEKLTQAMKGGNAGPVTLG
jgi:hypothetical protein